MTRFAALVAAAVLTVVGGQAFAQPAEDAPTARVQYADLDLSSTAGRATLDRRVEAAIRSVCPSTSAPMDLAGRAQVRKCRDQARAGADTQIASITSNVRFAQRVDTTRDVGG